MYRGTKLPVLSVYAGKGFWKRRIAWGEQGAGAREGGIGKVGGTEKEVRNACERGCRHAGAVAPPL